MECKTAYSKLKKEIWFITILISAFCFYGNHASAFDKDVFVKRFSEAFGKSVTVTYGTSIGEQDNLILDHVRIVGDPLSPDTSLGKVIFSGITEEPHGAFSIKSVVIPALRYVYEGNTVNVMNVTFNDISLPPNKGIYNQKIGFRYERGYFDQLELLNSEKKRLAFLENGVVILQPSIRQNPVNFSINIKKLTILADNFPDGSTRQDFIAMGYKNATGKLEIDGAYGGDQAIMQLNRFYLVLDRGGVLDIRLKMDGMTLDSLLTVVTLQRENENKRIKTTQMWLGMLAQVQRYNFYGGGLRYEDHSLTEKLINSEAKRLGINSDVLKAKWKNNLPGWLSFAKDTSFMNDAQNAITNYLDNPKSLEISSSPMGRLPLIMLAISGKLNPKQLVRELNLSIRANH